MGIILKEDMNFDYCDQKERNFYPFKRVVYPFVNIYYKMLLAFIGHFCNKENLSYKYCISLILIFKNESPFLDEWLCHHINLGVNHFYLYNNNSTDNYKKTLSSYIDKGLVTLIDWPEYPGQYSAYRHWYDNYRFESEWICFLDIDEFLCPMEEIELQPLLKRYKIYPVILMYWKLFGTSGVMDHDYNKLVIEQYTVCRDKLFTEGKVFYNTKFDIDDSFVSMHGFNIRWKYFKIPPFNVFKKVVIWNMHKKNQDIKTPIQVNHYWSKSYHCWKNKYEKGSIEKGTKWKDFSFFNQLEKKCISVDYSIFRFIVDIKLRMQQEKL